MALINLILDTDTKELKVLIDGAEIPDIAYFNASRWCDYDNPTKHKVSCSIELVPAISEDGSLRVNTNLLAYANADITIKDNIPQKELNRSVEKWLSK